MQDATDNRQRPYARILTPDQLLQRELQSMTPEETRKYLRTTMPATPEPVVEPPKRVSPWIGPFLGGIALTCLAAVSAYVIFYKWKAVSGVAAESAAKSAI